MQQVTRRNTKKIGNHGESIATKYLLQSNYTILVRNYAEKWGEIDVIAEKEQKIHFVEVKSVSHETRYSLEKSVAHATWRPEENIHQKKVDHLYRILQTWLTKNNCTKSWQIDSIAVHLVLAERFATVNLIENIGTS